MVDSRRPVARLRIWARGEAGGVRLRTTAGAVLVVGLALAVGGVALVLEMRRTLEREVRTAAELRARDVADVLESGTTPEALAVDDVEALLVQVVDPDGDVVASSPNVEGLPPVADIAPGESTEVRVPIDDDQFLAVAVGADTDDGRLVVLVARTLEAVDESTAVVTRLLAVGLPLLLVLVGLTTWRVVGRALRPVDSVRREVDEISAAALHRRVPVPTGGDEIARLAATMNLMLDRLEQAQARQRRFVSDASHELRSPVAAIRQHAEVAIAHPDRTTVGDLAEIVLAEDLRVQRLVDDLLVLARADEQTVDLRRRPMDLDDVVFDEARRARETSSLLVDTSAVSAGRVSADGAALRRVVRNLTDNAIRHARTRIAFALRESDGSVVLAVEDDGQGVPAEDRERVLERFVRLDHARARDEGGAGLGLAIVSELVRAHGGSVVVGTGGLGGARVEVTLPRLPDPGSPAHPGETGRSAGNQR